MRAAPVAGAARPRSLPLSRVANTRHAQHVDFSGARESTAQTAIRQQRARAPAAVEVAATATSTSERAASVTELLTHSADGRVELRIPNARCKWTCAASASARRPDASRSPLRLQPLSSSQLQQARARAASVTGAGYPRAADPRVEMQTTAVGRACQGGCGDLHIPARLSLTFVRTWPTLGPTAVSTSKSSRALAAAHHTRMRHACCTWTRVPLVAMRTRQGECASTSESGLERLTRRADGQVGVRISDTRCTWGGGLAQRLREHGADTRNRSATRPCARSSLAHGDCNEHERQHPRSLGRLTRRANRQFEMQTTAVGRACPGGTLARTQPRLDPLQYTRARAAPRTRAAHHTRHAARPLHVDSRGTRSHAHSSWRVR